MTEPTYDPRPQLHPACVQDDRRGACPTYPVTCRDQQGLWDSGYAAGRNEVDLERAELLRRVKEQEEFLGRTALGGSIVSSAVMTPMQIAIAHAAARVLVTPDGLGFVYAPSPAADGWLNAGAWMKRAEAAESKLAELKSANRYQRGYSDGQKEGRERAEAKLAELVREIRDQLPERGKGLRFGEILDKYDKREGL